MILQAIVSSSLFSFKYVLDKKWIQKFATDIVDVCQFLHRTAQDDSI